MPATNKDYVFKRLDKLALGEVLAIENQVQVAPWSKPKFLNCFDNDQYQVTGLFYSARLIGYSVLLINPPEGELHNLAISTDFQNQGLGSIFLNYLIAESAKYQLEKIFLEVRTSNIAAIKTYQNSGFSQIGTRQNYYRSEAGIESAMVFMLEINTALTSG